MALVVVDGDPKRAILRQQPPDDLQSVAHQPQPDGMFKPIVVVCKCIACVVGWVNEYALNFPSKFLLQCLQRQQVVPEDQSVVEDVVISYSLFSVVRLLWFFEQDARLQLGPL